MKKPELEQITAALRQLTPNQRKRIAIQLAALDAQPASTVLIERRFASITADLKPRYKTFAVCPHATWTAISAGFVPSTVIKGVNRNPSSG